MRRSGYYTRKKHTSVQKPYLDIIKLVELKEGSKLSTNNPRRETLANKYPEMEQHFQEIKKDMYKPKIDRLGETKEEQLYPINPS